jgi:outer membrane protein TolC
MRVGFLFALSFGMSVHFQVAFARQIWTVKDVLEYAARNAPETGIIRNELEAGRQQIRFFRSYALPQATIGAGGSYVSLSPEGATTVGGDGGAGPTPIDLPSSAQAQQPGDTAAPANGIPTAALSDRINGAAMNWSLSVRQPIATFGRVGNALKLGKLQDSVLGIQEKLRYNQFHFSVLQSFAEAYRAQQQVGIAQLSLATAEKLLLFTNTRIETGTGSRVDLLRARAGANAAQADLLLAKSAKETAFESLATITAVPLALSDSLAIDQQYCPAPESQTFSAESGYEYRLTSLRARMRQLRAQFDKSALFPAFYAVGGVSNSVFLGDQKEVSFFTSEDQKALDIIAPSFFTYTIGIQFTWTAYNGFRTIAQYRQTVAESQQDSIRLQLLEDRNESALQ